MPRRDGPPPLTAIEALALVVTLLLFLSAAIRYHLDKSPQGHVYHRGEGDSPIEHRIDTR